MKTFRRNHFTLLELTAVITILILLTAVSSVYVGRERKGAAFEQALRELRVFCAKARAECMRDGRMRKVVFYPEENIFRIEKVEHYNESEAFALAEDVEGGNVPYVVLEAIDPELETELAAEDESNEAAAVQSEKVEQWAFPEKLGVQFEFPEFENLQLQEESIELWRYTRGGGARLSHELSLQFNDDVRIMTVSDFSGLLEVVRADEQEGKKIW